MHILIAAIVCFILGICGGYLWAYGKLTPRIAKAETERDSEIKTNMQLKEQIAQQETGYQESLKQRKEEWEQLSQERMETLKTEFQVVSQHILEEQQKRLAQGGQQQLAVVVEPLKEYLNSLKHDIQDANEKRASGKTSFDEAMRRLMEQTAEIGTQTERLTKALKGESKTQGDWGEMILDSILEHSGLRQGEEYFTQEVVKSTNGQLLRPDVVVRFPDQRSVVIDSKVSLTAYMDYLNAVDEISAKEAATLHTQSVRKHVDELAAKDYSSIVEGADNYVLMFLQSDAAYILAVKNDDKLNQYAFSKHVIITCPTTLMMTLQIIYNIWQSDRQSRNVTKIITKANALYDKFAGFIDNFHDIGKSIHRSSEIYDKALGQLTEGKGNLISRIEDFKEMGLSPKKELRIQSTENDNDIEA